MENVRDLNVYKMSFKLAIGIYKATEHFPKSELFGLTSQMRRAVISINSNLCEGSYRNSTNEYRHFVGVAKGSAAELRFQIEIAKEIGFMNLDIADKYIKNVEEICKMLSGLFSALENKKKIKN